MTDIKRLEVVEDEDEVVEDLEDELEEELEEFELENFSVGEDIVEETTFTGAYYNELSQYLQDIEHFPRLSSDEEIDLAKKIEAGNIARALLASEYTSLDTGELRRTVAAGDAAREKFINANYKLVVSIAKRYFKKVTASITILDIVQSGNLGLIKAVDRYDYTKGFKFSTFATWWIRQHINRDFLNEAYTIRLPIHMHELLSKIRRLRGQNELITVEELAEALNISENKVTRLLQIQDGMIVAYLDRQVLSTEDGFTSLLDLLPSEILPPDLINNQQDRDNGLFKIMAKRLTDREHYVLTRRFGLIDNKPATLEIIGADLGITRERVRQIESRAINKLRAPRIYAELKDLASLK